jgi:hypothetical protein
MHIVALRFLPVEPCVGIDLPRHVIVGFLAKKNVKSEAFRVELILWKPTFGDIGRASEPLATTRSVAHKDSGRVAPCDDADSRGSDAGLEFSGERLDRLECQFAAFCERVEDISRH